MRLAHPLLAFDEHVPEESPDLELFDLLTQDVGRPIGDEAGRLGAGQ